MNEGRNDNDRPGDTGVTTAGEPTGDGDGAEQTYRRRPYDRAFEPAVLHGYLTVGQATQRNNRQGYAEALARRYDLPMDLALQVTDNRIRLHEALRALGDRTARRAVAGTTRRWASPGFMLLVGVTAGLAVLGTVTLATIQWNRNIETARRLEQGSFGNAGQDVEDPAPRVGTLSGDASLQARIHRDSRGNITLVTASKPELVMETICGEALASGYCATLSIDQVMPEFPNAKIGRFSEVTDLGRTWIVHLRRDSATGRWRAGDGHRPLLAVIDPASTRSN